MSAEQERAYVKNAYPFPKWHQKVDAMPDDRVIAIYLRMIGEDPKPKNEKEDQDDLRLF